MFSYFDHGSIGLPLWIPKLEVSKISGDHTGTGPKSDEFGVSGFSDQNMSHFLKVLRHIFPDENEDSGDIGVDKVVLEDNETHFGESSNSMGRLSTWLWLWLSIGRRIGSARR